MTLGANFKMRFSRVMVKFHGISSCVLPAIYIDKSYSHKLIDLKAWVKVITIYTEFSIFGNISPIYRCILKVVLH